jgi:hypothetical protein
MLRSTARPRNLHRRLSPKRHSRHLRFFSTWLLQLNLAEALLVRALGCIKLKRPIADVGGGVKAFGCRQIPVFAF